MEGQVGRMALRVPEDSGQAVGGGGRCRDEGQMDFFLLFELAH